MSASEPTEKLRIDKWLWAARFFKTRSLAAQAVEGGKIKLNGQRVKPAKELHVNDALEIHIGEAAWHVHVRGLSARRGPAEAARMLYEESAESQAQRQAQAALRRVEYEPATEIHGRPTKRDRRMLKRLTGDG